MDVSPAIKQEPKVKFSKKKKSLYDNIQNIL